MESLTSIEGQVAVVTGGTAGMGEAACIRFGAAGAKVAAEHRSDVQALLFFLDLDQRVCLVNWGRRQRIKDTRKCKQPRRSSDLKPLID